jgi:4-amino-4-deoxy-L-arabinose transferase-like glycosyltransferase
MAVPVAPMSDSGAYETFALNIAQGHSYGWERDQPSAFWPVGTSAIYAFFFWLFGHDYTPIVFFQALVGLAVVALGSALGRLWLGEATGVLTAWVLACWPLLIQYTTLLASELHFIFFILLGFWLASLPAKGWLARAALTGVALAAASYVRPLAILMAPLAYLQVGAGGERLRALVGSCVAMAVMGVCILPWTVRNWQVFDRFVLISTNGGTNFWMGNNASGSIQYMKPPETGIANEADRDAFLGREARNYILQEPAAFLVRTARKVVALHDRETIGITWNEQGIGKRAGESALQPLKIATTAYWWAMLALALYGICAYVTKSGWRMLLACPAFLTWFYFTLVHAVTVAGDRYHVPSVPFIGMFAAYGLGQIMLAATGRKSA